MRCVCVPAATVVHAWVFGGREFESRTWQFFSVIDFVNYVFNRLSSRSEL